MEHIEKIVTGLIKKNFYKKFTQGYKVSAKSAYNFCVYKLHMTYLKSEPFSKFFKKIVSKFYVKYNRIRKDKELDLLQKKYSKLQIKEAFFYLSLHDKMKLCKDDLVLYEEMLDILFAKLKK